LRKYRALSFALLIAFLTFGGVSIVQEFAAHHHSEGYSKLVTISPDPEDLIELDLLDKKLTPNMSILLGLLISPILVLLIFSISLEKVIRRHQLYQPVFYQSNYLISSSLII
jgi:hypothetical protein